MSFGWSEFESATLLAASVAAFSWGGQAGKHVGLILLISEAARVCLALWLGGGAVWPQIAVQGVAATLLVRLAMQRTPHWTLFAAAFQLLAFLCPLASRVGLLAEGTWLAAAQSSWRWLLAALLAGAALRRRPTALEAPHSVSDRLDSRRA